MDKHQLAAVGYNRYREAGAASTFDGRPMPTWEQLDELPNGARTKGLPLLSRTPAPSGTVRASASTASTMGLYSSTAIPVSSWARRSSESSASM